MSDPRQLSLNLFFYPGGHHEAASRYSGSSGEAARRSNTARCMTAEAANQQSRQRDLA
jgi:hypothetical protein